MTSFIRRGLGALYLFNLGGAVVTAAIWLGGPDDSHASKALVCFIVGSVGCLVTLAALTFAEERGL